MANISSTINKPVLISSTLPVYTSGGAPSDSYRLNENDDYYLLENGDYKILG